MTKPQDQDPMEAVFRRMGEPSWLILRVLNPADAIPGIEIIRRVEDLLETAEYPYKRLDPSTLHYALKRMAEDGLVRCEGQREVEVPGPRGTSRRESRPVYVITGLGAEALDRRRLLEAIVPRAALLARVPGLALEGRA